MTLLRPVLTGFWLIFWRPETLIIVDTLHNHFLVIFLHDVDYRVACGLTRIYFWQVRAAFELVKNSNIEIFWNWATFRYVNLFNLFKVFNFVLAWFTCSAIWGSNLCFNLGFFTSPRKLSDEWPHELIPWEAKLYFIFQVQSRYNVYWE